MEMRTEDRWLGQHRPHNRGPRPRREADAPGRGTDMSTAGVLARGLLAGAIGVVAITASLASAPSSWLSYMGMES